MPVTLPTQSGHYSLPFAGSEFQEVSYLRSCITPLFPVAHSQPTPNPMIKNGNRTVVLCNSKVLYPTSDVLSEFHHSILHGYSPTSAGEFPDASLELLKRFVSPADCAVTKGKAKK